MKQNMQMNALLIVRLLQKFPNQFVKHIYHEVAAGFAAKLSKLLKMPDHHPYTFLPISLVSEDDRTFQ